MSKRKRFTQYPVPPSESSLLVLLGMVIGTELIAVPLLVAAVILLNLDPSRIFQFSLLMHVIGAIGGAMWIRFWPPVFFRRLKKVPAIVVGRYGNPTVLPIDPDCNENDRQRRADQSRIDQSRIDTAHQNGWRLMANRRRSWTPSVHC